MRKRWAGLGAAAGVLGLVGGLGSGLAGNAGAATNPNFSFARTAGPFGIAWGFPMSGFGVSFGTHRAVNVSFRVNGQGGVNFSVPSVTGNVYDQSSANATSTYCQACTTNAIAITIDVVSGPLSVVYAPTSAVVNTSNCVSCNVLAADYTFVVSPGVQAGLTPAGLAALSSIAQQVTADANAPETSQVLAGQVVDALNQIAADLSNPALVDPNGVPAPSPVPPGVQRFGSIQIQTS